MDNFPKIKLTKQGTEIFCYRGKEIETDRKDNKIYDSVLPIYPGSGVHYLIDNLIVRTDDFALDLCTGSGIFGIYAADKASRVIATDINPRALDFAARNAERNQVRNIEFRQGDLFEPVEGLKFDYIISNPPFAPIPKDFTAALHTAGGVDGLVFVRKILSRVEEFLNPTGRMQLYSLSFGTKEHSLLEDLLRTNLNNKSITMISFYSEPLPVEDYTSAFRQYGVKDWAEELKRKGITHLHSYIIDIKPCVGLKIRKAMMPASERKKFPDNWYDWKKKFPFWVLNK